MPPLLLPPALLLPQLRPLRPLSYFPCSPKRPFKKSIPRTPYNPSYDIQWDFNTSAFLGQPHVKGKPPKLITWFAPPGYLPSMPDPVRLRTCPEMPCRMTTNQKFREESAALIWNAQGMREEEPPVRTSSEQVRYIPCKQNVPGKTLSSLTTASLA